MLNTFAKRNKIIFYLPVLLLVASIGFYSTAFAHVLKTDNNIGVVLHIDPNDNPVANEPATLIFEIKDTQNKFSLPNCDCNLAIASNGQLISSFPVTGQGTDNTGIIKFTFPGKSVYSLTLTGQPKGNANFQKFSLEWDWRVDQTAAAAGTTSSAAPQSFWAEHGLHIVFFGGAIFANFFFLFRNKRKEKQAALKMQL